ncbi:MAG: hypothetical protein PX481_23795 [Microcystis sp. M53603_WE2]|uniref:hypothetical protein n=2 Tax=unclassified Microcystis TaxID=2643300 RepID=UPI00258DB3E1|nr:MULTISPECIES: hypothetical protein [unclassified Microcystis]MDJ0527641.1 hypothetical protein [Microcystis sp. M53600_WE12]MDJ0541643.1 hypothetical protein [Microcystis sp. M53603_WE2]MDJ0562868.1 hypothetical protein [Microcystis sp. M49629_WE12]MDJ0604104.1 hypothetical protein [Microcystis sp. M53602_WE12]
MKKFSPPQMKEVFFPTPHTPHPTPSFKSGDSETGDCFYLFSLSPHFPTSPLPHSAIITRSQKYVGEYHTLCFLSKKLFFCNKTTQKKDHHCW